MFARGQREVRDQWCAAALRLTHRLVVPVAFLPELRAEQTTAMFCEVRLALAL